MGRHCRSTGEKKATLDDSAVALPAVCEFYNNSRSDWRDAVLTRIRPGCTLRLTPFPRVTIVVLESMVIEDDLELSAESDVDFSRAAAPKLTFSMKTRDAFFARVTTQLRSQLPAEYASFTARPMFNLMKIAFDNERVHYEVAFDNVRRSLEIALHFEDGPVSTVAYLRYMDQRIVELKHVMGHEIELERWTLTWGRIYEIWPLESLDRPVADRVATRLTTYITTLQPLVLASGIAPERSAQPAQPRGHWKRTARTRPV
jgi:hypothetical protein